MDYSKNIKAYIAKEIEVLNMLDIDTINLAINEIVAAFEREGNIYIFGNGGSAATASHFANDFNKGISEYTKKKFRFICLNDNVPTVMAVANDISYDEIFRFQLLGKLKHEDLVIGISGSGNSKNVVNAIEYAKQEGIRTLGITGFNGGKVKQIVDVSLHVPINNMQITEDIHMVFDHMIMTVLYQVWNLLAIKF
ncbi:SIS domain-containing protein [Clostridium sp. YIM B02515]|uniref:SIS domain-containing protein n=1 Tax=Clostridium rhizosphaerae TaxID=2803861 RepID=A0ABS1T5S2_9CLOT|nr:SIS domain-containing protein [Clostridium rhizosphaerae]MBL4934680.1 SIS domain-containing protein [Clostridium rhizosphaerae]